MMQNLVACACLLLSSTAVFAQDKLLPADTTIEQAVDHYIDAKLTAAGITPAPPADDAAILRRLTLDLNGRVPTLTEMDDYLKSSDPDKKAKLVERLLASPAFSRHGAQTFYAFMQYAEGRPRKGDKGNGLYDYLLASFSENRGWDRMFKDILLPNETAAKDAGAAEFLKTRVKDLNRLTIDTSSTFFGVNVSCAQCHDHPHVQQWTQDQFYGMKSFFARTVDSGGFLGERDFGVVKYIPINGKEKVSPVLFLTGKTIDAPGMKEPTGEEKRLEQKRLDLGKKTKAPPAPLGFGHRGKLVEVALAPESRDFFARNIANRMVHRFLGRGLVMPLDQVHSENKASHPELLDWLGRDTATHDYDLKRSQRAAWCSPKRTRGRVVGKATRLPTNGCSQSRPCERWRRCRWPRRSRSRPPIRSRSPQTSRNASKPSRGTRRAWRTCSSSRPTDSR